MDGLMRPLRLATLAISLALLGTLVAAADARKLEGEPTVSCDRVALHPRPGAHDGSRVLLGAVAFPGSRQLADDTSATADRRWRYFRDAGLLIRAGASAVVVSVPEGWRDRVAVSWGDSPVSSSLRFARCDRLGAGAWNAYSGGFHLHARGDCVPLVVRVGGMSTTVRVGIGRACGGRP